jgi:hypothetical protein
MFGLQTRTRGGRGADGKRVWNAVPVRGGELRERFGRLRMMYADIIRVIPTTQTVEWEQRTFARLTRICDYLDARNSR